MKKDELTKEFDGYMKDHPEIDYLSFGELETVDGDGEAGLDCVNHFTRYFAEAVPPERRYVILPKFTARGG